MTGAGVDTAVTSEKLGPLAPVAGASTFKPIFYGLTHLLYAAMFGAPGGVLVYIALTEGNEDRWTLLGIGAVFSLLGLLTLFASLRRFGVVGHQQVRIDAGPGGIRLVVPESPGIGGFFRLTFALKTYELTWGEVAKWYPYLRTVNGIPTESALIFEGQSGWRVNANTMFYGASRGTLVARIEAALKPAG